MSKGLFTGVKCKQRISHANMILPVFSKSHKLISLQKSCSVADSITFQSFSGFLNLSKSCQEKGIFAQCHNASLHSKFHQTASKINSERSPLHKNWHFTRTVYHLSLILKSFRTKPKLIKDNANRLRKLNLNSRIFEFTTACLKIKILRMRKNVTVFL